MSRLNPLIPGWARYFSNGISPKTYDKMDQVIIEKLGRCIKRRHPNKTLKWWADKYFHTVGKDNWTFSTKDGLALASQADTPIKGHIKIKGAASAINGDWAYWSI